MTSERRQGDSPLLCAHHTSRESRRQVRREAIPEYIYGRSRLHLRPTWEELVARIPGLAEFVAGVEATYQPQPGFCDAEVWYGKVKPALERLVGHANRGHAYVWDAVATYVYRALPNCDHEDRAGCVGYVYADRRGAVRLYVVRAE